MEKFITATGKTIDLAIAAALEELHMDRDSVSVMERVYVELRNSHKDGAISALDQFVQSRERAAK